MSEQIWLVALAALLIGCLIGYFVARFSGPGKRLHELEEEIIQQKEQMAEYRKNVDDHFDKTANLFVSMTGSYKELYEHLSSGYEKLAPGTRSLFRERVATLLLTETPDAMGPHSAPNDFIREKTEESQVDENVQVSTPEVRHVVEEYEEAFTAYPGTGNPEEAQFADREQETEIPVLNDRVDNDAFDPEEPRESK